MTKTKRGAVIGCLGFFLMLQSFCTIIAKQQSPLIGEWIFEEDGERVTLVFKEGGAFSITYPDSTNAQGHYIVNFDVKPHQLSLVISEKQERMVTIFEFIEKDKMKFDELTIERESFSTFSENSVILTKAKTKQEKEEFVSEADTQEETFTNSIGMEFVLIPSGSFIMGSDDESPRHHVTISQPFYIGKYEVTQEQWDSIMGSNPSRLKMRGNPVDDVSWSTVQEFLRLLNSKENTMVYRLPTEAEWEYACRAGTTTNYGFGDDEDKLKEYAWYDGNSEKRAHQTGQLKPNVWGVYDMHGNIWEWVQDRWEADYYSNSPLNDPLGPSSGEFYVLRGGSWNHPPSSLRCADRYALHADASSPVVGLRVHLLPVFYIVTACPPL